VSSDNQYGRPTIFSTDGYVGRPQPEFQGQYPSPTGHISVGSREVLKHGLLECKKAGDDVIVTLSNAAGEEVSQRLVFTPADPASIQNGTLVPESSFDTQVTYYIHSPWHDGETNVAIFTVAGHRKDGNSVFHKVIKD